MLHVFLLALLRIPEDVKRGQWAGKNVRKVAYMVLCHLHITMRALCICLLVILYGLVHSLLLVSPEQALFRSSMDHH